MKDYSDQTEENLGEGLEENIVKAKNSEETQNPIIVKDKYELELTTKKRIRR